MNLSADVVICFDMLWHIIDDEIYTKTLKNIKQYAKRNILIFTWHKNPLANPLIGLLALAIAFKKTGKFPRDWSFISDGNYQKYRPFLEIAEPIFKPEFSLIESHIWEPGKYHTLYIFQRNES